MNIIKILIGIISLLFFFLIFQIVSGILEIDIIVNVWAQGFWTETGKIFFMFIAWLGDVYGIILQALIFVGFLIYKKEYFKSKLLVFLILLTVGTSTLIKLLVERNRPENMIMEYGGFSFPSGHSTMAILFYGLLIFLLLKNIKNNITKYISIIFIIIFSLLIMFSRVYLSVHWFSDVIGGILLGSFYLLLGILFYNKSNKK